jgi:hypothetical protein
MGPTPKYESRSLDLEATAGGALRQRYRRGSPALQACRGGEQFLCVNDPMVEGNTTGDRNQ